MRRLEGFSVDAWFVNDATGSPTEPSQQFAQHHRPANAKQDDRPGFPEQNMDELVQLRIWHATESSSFVA
jgi:hypothetical protein